VTASSDLSRHRRSPDVLQRLRSLHSSFVLASKWTVGMTVPSAGALSGKGQFSSFRYYGANSIWNRALPRSLAERRSARLHTSILQVDDYKWFGSANGG
jgi:hypothetical protein